MDPKSEKITKRSIEIESILDHWGFIKDSASRDRKRAQIKDWLSNFLPSEMDDAFLILSKIQYKDDKMIRSAIGGKADYLLGDHNHNSHSYSPVQQVG